MSDGIIPFQVSDAARQRVANRRAARGLVSGAPKQAPAATAPASDTAPVALPAASPLPQGRPGMAECFALWVLVSIFVLTLLPITVLVMVGY